jgi:ubiquinone/menaquinone biosynthesis C-methylase UbiE/uncharacterized protein YbaR (Trm112 family)
MIDIKLLSCPHCQTPLLSFQHCNNCNLEFDFKDEIPSLFAPKTSRKVQFEFQATRSSVEKKTLEKYLNNPPIAEYVKSTPYHLDPAHVYIFNQLSPNQNILEIGCGGGQSRHWFQEQGHQYIGVDISKTRIHQWLQEFGGPDLLCDAHFLPFRNQQFDVVYASAVTEHLACPILAFQEIMRVLKPGGYFLGNVSFLEPWHDDSFFHLSALGVIELLTEAGFEIKCVWPGRGYSGYEAIFKMGNKFTKSLSWVGKLTYLGYQLSNQLTYFTKRLFNRPSPRNIEKEAIVAGAIDWIVVSPS